jgi:hypothetical protein
LFSFFFFRWASPNEPKMSLQFAVFVLSCIILIYDM